MTLQENISSFLWSMGITDRWLKTFGRSYRFVLAMHGIANRRYPNLDNETQPCLMNEDLRNILFWLSSRFHFLTPDEFLNSVNPGVLLTFDDGYQNNYINALPLLEEFKAPAVFFVTVQHVLNPKEWLPSIVKSTQNYWDSADKVPANIAQDIFDGMSVEQLKKCAKNPLITIGSHSFSHPFLSSCNQEELVLEIVNSKNILQDILNIDVRLFAYPTGDYDKRVIEMVRKAGYMAAFAADSKQVDQLRYEIPRIGIYFSSDHYLGMKLSGFHRRPIFKKPII
jgi:hypothetical protein